MAVKERGTMETRIIATWVLLLLSPLATAVEVHEPQEEDGQHLGPTTALPLADLTTTGEAPELPVADNGMAVVQLPEQVTASSVLSLVDQKGEEEGEEGESPVAQAAEEQQDGLGASLQEGFKLPENHKQFAASPYLGTIETPPLLQSFNKYQQQYKEYYAQKQQYHEKANSQEGGAHENRLVTQGLGAFAEGRDKLQFRNKPFPYAYENRFPPSGYEATATEGVDAAAPVHEHAEGHHQLPIQHSPLLGFSGHVEVAGAGLKQQGAVRGHGEDLKDHSEFFRDHGLGLGGDLKNHGLGHAGDFKDHGFGLAGDLKDLGVGHGGDHALGHKKPSTWKKVLRMLTALIPLGVFIASLTPTVLAINSTTEQKPSRQRSLDGLELRPEDLADPLVQLMQHYGLEALDDPACEDRLFCEMSRMGANETSNFVQKGFWYLAHETPEDMAQQVGMRELFKAIRTGTCDMFHCEPKKEKVGAVTTKVDDRSGRALDGKRIKTEKKRKVVRRKKV